MKLIKINTDHYVIVDDSEIKEGDYCTTHLNVIDVGKIHNSYTIFNPQNKEHLDMVKSCKKITHSTQPLGKPMLFTNAFESDLAISTMGLHDTVIENWGCKKIPLSEVKELIGEVDVEKKAAQNSDTYQKELGYIKGYNQALEDNKEKKYTEEDMRKAMDMIIELQSVTSSKYTPEQVIQSIQPKTSWEVEIVDGKLKLK